jgi:hypothetical protein
VSTAPKFGSEAITSAMFGNTTLNTGLGSTVIELRGNKMNGKLPAPCEVCGGSRLRHGGYAASAKERAIAYLATGVSPRCSSKVRNDGNAGL